MIQKIRKKEESVDFCQAWTVTFIRVFKASKFRPTYENKKCYRNSFCSEENVCYSYLSEIRGEKYDEKRSKHKYWLRELKTIIITLTHIPMHAVSTKYRTSANISPQCASDLLEFSESIFQFRPVAQTRACVTEECENVHQLDQVNAVNCFSSVQQLYLWFAIQQSASKIFNYRQVKCLNEYKSSECRSPRIIAIHYCPYLVIRFNWKMSGAQATDISDIVSFDLSKSLKSTLRYLGYVSFIN